MGSNTSKDIVKADNFLASPRTQEFGETAQASRKPGTPVDLAMTEEAVTPSKLLSMPPEVKNRIYEQIFTMTPTPAKLPRNGVAFLRLRTENMLPKGRNASSVLSLLATCREINKDAAGVFHDQINIMLTVFGNDNIRAFLTISTPRLNAIRRLSVLTGCIQQSIELLPELSGLERLEEIYFYHMAARDDGHGTGIQIAQDLRTSLPAAQAAVRTLPKVKRFYWNVSWEHQLPERLIEELRALEVQIDGGLPENSGRQPTKRMNAIVSQQSANIRGRPFPAQPGRGGCVSSPCLPTMQIVTQRNSEGDVVAWEERYNPMFETGPAPEVWHRGGSSSLPFGENKYQERAISDQINDDLYGPPGRTLGASYAAPTRPRRDMWALPKLTQEEMGAITAKVQRKHPDYVPAKLKKEQLDEIRAERTKKYDKKR